MQVVLNELESKAYYDIVKKVGLYKLEDSIEYHEKIIKDMNEIANILKDMRNMRFIPNELHGINSYIYGNSFCDNGVPFGRRKLYTPSQIINMIIEENKKLLLKNGNDNCSDKIEEKANKKALKEVKKRQELCDKDKELTRLEYEKKLKEFKKSFWVRVAKKIFKIEE